MGLLSKGIRIMILYFSGTGNSEYVAKKIADITGDTLFSITDAVKKNFDGDVTSSHSLVFVTPTYAWRLPRVVEKWIEKINFTGCSKVYFVMTCGDGIGNAAAYLQKLCKKKGFTYMGCAGVMMPENYVAMFPVPCEDEALSIVRRADPVIERTAEKIKTEEELPQMKVSLAGKIESGIVNELFYKFCVKSKAFYTKDTCVGCGRCQDICPMNNIIMENGKPKWKNACTHCMACICGCPQKAVEYGKQSQGKPRYHCPL